MKKIVLAILAIVMVIAMSGCTQRVKVTSYSTGVMDEEVYHEETVKNYIIVDGKWINVD